MAMLGALHAHTLSRRDRRWLSGIVRSMEVHDGPYWLPHRHHGQATAPMWTWILTELEEGLEAAAHARRRLFWRFVAAVPIVDTGVLLLWLGVSAISPNPPRSPWIVLAVASVLVLAGRKLAEAAYSEKYLGYPLAPRARELYDGLAAMSAESRRDFVDGLRGSGYAHTAFLIERSWSLKGLIKGRGP